MQIKFTINDFEVRKRLTALAAQGHSLRPLMQDIGEEVRRIVEKNFEAGGRPERWKPSARSKRDGGKPLTDKGTLRRSMTVDADSKSVRVGTNVIYAGIHQFGGKAGRGRKVNIPARPFLVISDADQSRIEKIAEDYLGEIIK
jgi:phage virion morphogenesis protein